MRLERRRGICLFISFTVSSILALTNSHTVVYTFTLVLCVVSVLSLSIDWVHQPHARKHKTVLLFFIHKHANICSRLNRYLYPGLVLF